MSGRKKAKNTQLTLFLDSFFVSFVPFCGWNPRFDSSHSVQRLTTTGKVSHRGIVAPTVLVNLQFHPALRAAELLALLRATGTLTG
jgi:hypothetical protein